MASSMSLTLRKITTAAVSASTFFTRFLRVKPPSTATSCFTNHRYLSSATITNNQPAPESDPEEASKHDPSIMIKQGSPQQGLKMENPLQSGGPKDLVAVDEVKDGLLVRILLPGVGEDGCKVWVENNTVFFSGKGDIECENEISGRSYGGSLEFDPKLNKVDEIKSEMKHGILRMIVPKAS